MKYVTNVTAEEKKEIERITRFIDHETFEERFCFSGNFTIAGSIEDGEKHIDHCCGEAFYDIYLSNGRRVVLCFDFGH